MIISKTASGQRERETPESLWAPYLLHKQNTFFPTKGLFGAAILETGTHNKDQKGHTHTVLNDKKTRAVKQPLISSKPHWLSMGLPEISRAVWQPWTTSRHLHWLHILTYMVTIYENSITTYHTRSYISNPSEKCIHFQMKSFQPKTSRESA